MNLRSMLVGALIAVVAIGCGAEGGGQTTESVPVAVSSTVPALLADLDLEVVGDQSTELCFAGQSAALDVTFERRCYPPPHEQAVIVAAGALVTLDDPSMNSATLMVSPYPLAVTAVHQEGVEVVWRQVGQGLVVIGKSLLAAPTEVTFTIDGKSGRCHFSPDKERCSIG